MTCVFYFFVVLVLESEAFFFSIVLRKNLCRLLLFWLRFLNRVYVAALYICDEERVMFDSLRCKTSKACKNACGCNVHVDDDECNDDILFAPTR